MREGQGNGRVRVKHAYTKAQISESRGSYQIVKRVQGRHDEEERRINNRRVNHHIADNFDKYYVNKIALPYIETVGVGQHKRKVKFSYDVASS